MTFDSGPRVVDRNIRELPPYSPDKDEKTDCQDRSAL